MKTAKEYYNNFDPSNESVIDQVIYHAAHIMCSPKLNCGNWNYWNIMLDSTTFWCNEKYTEGVLIFNDNRKPVFTTLTQKDIRQMKIHNQNEKHKYFAMALLAKLTDVKE